MKKTFNLINLFLIIAILIGDAFYMMNPNTVWIKAVSSLGFVALSAINLIYVLKNKFSNKIFAIIMVVGAFFGMLGDILLEFVFIAGAALFAVGHVCYFVAYLFITKFQWKDLIYGVAIFVPATLVMVLAPIFDFYGLQFVCIVYALIISIMVGKAISNFVQHKSKLTLLILIGSILFMFSDIILLCNYFGTFSMGWVSHLCLATYYPAQCLLAYSLLHTNQENN